jgi:hypothetical protein
MPRRHLTLVPPSSSEETCSELKRLLRDAQAGKIVGLAYVAITPRAYSVDAVGAARDRPTFTRGAIRALDDLMRERSPRQR